MTSESPAALAKPGLTTTPDGRVHCFWRDQLPVYHDQEWGRPVIDDRLLFEKICLEGFQAGMSWSTIYNKRENFRRAFEQFDFHRVARFTDQDVERLLGDASIVRNKAKILSTINNARRAIEFTQREGSLADWLWSFAPPPDERPAVVDLAYWNANPTSPSSVRLSKALKQRGWTFVGPTTMYALMQAVGMVNDHIEGCECRARIDALRQALTHGLRV